MLNMPGGSYSVHSEDFVSTKRLIQFRGSRQFLGQPLGVRFGGVRYWKAPLVDTTVVSGEVKQVCESYLRNESPTPPVRSLGQYVFRRTRKTINTRDCV